MHCAYLQLPSLPCTAREVQFGIGEALILVGSCPAETPFRDRSDPIIMMVVPSRQTSLPNIAFARMRLHGLWSFQFGRTSEQFNQTYAGGAAPRSTSRAP